MNWKLAGKIGVWSLCLGVALFGAFAWGLRAAERYDEDVATHRVAWQRLVEAEQQYLHRKESPAAALLFLDSALRYAPWFPDRALKWVDVEALESAWESQGAAFLEGYAGSVVYASSDERLSISAGTPPKQAAVRIDYIRADDFDFQPPPDGTRGDDAVKLLYQAVLNHLKRS